MLWGNNHSSTLEKPQLSSNKTSVLLQTFVWCLWLWQVWFIGFSSKTEPGRASPIFLLKFPTERKASLPITQPYHHPPRSVQSSCNLWWCPESAGYQQDSKGTGRQSCLLVTHWEGRRVWLADGAQVPPGSSPRHLLKANKHLNTAQFLASWRFLGKQVPRDEIKRVCFS